MTSGTTLQDHLGQAAARSGAVADAAAAVLAIAGAGRKLADLLASAPLAASRGLAANGSADAADERDVQAHDLMLQALRSAPVAAALIGAAEAPLLLDPAQELAAAIVPLDKSSNIGANAPAGTVFSILPAATEPAAAFLLPGRGQVAAGFMIYGLNTSLVVTLGDGARIFTLDRTRGAFVAAGGPVSIPAETSEYAIDGSARRHWDSPVRAYVEDCQAGAEGPRGRDFSTSWTGSLVAEAYRIMVRGGICLCPADARKGHGQGRLRLVHEINPLAMLAEQAGAAATDGRARILDLQPASLHQRTPFMFGSRNEVAEVAACHARPEPHATSPLFATRSLFRV